MLPTFVIVGAAKTATTWTKECLSEHPQVFMQGEIRYFSLHYDKGLDWYEAQFCDAKDGQEIGEKSPSYIYYPEVPRRMHELIPRLKLLFLLRDPVKRAFSNYCMDLRSGHERAPPAEALVPGRRVVDDGFYHRHLQRFRTFFPDEQIHLALQDDLKVDARRYISRIYAFVGVDSSFEPSLLNHRLRTRNWRPRSAVLHRVVVHTAQQLSRSSKTLDAGIRALRKSPGARLFHLVNKGPDFPDFPSDVQKRLTNLYRDDVARLSEHVGRDLEMLWLSKYDE